ncbi:hypothetical protein CGZ88_0507 [Bifidobacterium anseris]|uniref:DUF3021 domain-containing protein n=1 Tax=Bifidobacterium anseris TaxID=2020963 RepID=A0A2N5J2A1_9BIFI|nr:DUF3021 family protein [Bifidobacterium anseris]PLS28345.1 hypothetical protein CGZ88_0507 [Bifidobacterium anseris]
MNNSNPSIGKTLAIYTATGIGIASFIGSLFSGIVGMIMGGSTGSMLVKQFVATLVIGIAFGAPAIIWVSDRLATWIKLIVAIVPGTIIYTCIAWWIGWIPREYGVWAVISTIVMILVVTLIICAICGVVFRSNVRTMNDYLKRRQQISH